MAGDKILVLGGTGPAGICLLRELVHRGHPTIAYCRTPSKLPVELTSNPLLEVIKGELTERDALSTAVSKSHAVLSLLGPSGTNQPKNTELADYYQTVISLMKEHQVRRIFAMGTISIYQPADKTSFTRFALKMLVKMLFGGAYFNIIAVQELFEKMDGKNVDWTVFRLGILSGSSDNTAWSTEREIGTAYAGPVADPGWTSSMNRSILARWLVDATESKSKEWLSEMPAVSQKA